MEEGKEKPYKSFETPKPVSVGDEIDVEIESVGGQGDGIAKVNGFVVFVKGANKGERIKIKIADVKRTYAIGEKIGAAAEAPEAPAEEPAEEPAKEEAPAEEAPAEAEPKEEEAPAEEEAAPEEEKKEEAPSE
jgi:predicted RNA-binding protein with TRAM domain